MYTNSIDFAVRMGLIALTAAVLHLIWENVHVSLYGGYENISALPITFYATLGDVAYTIAAVALVSFLKNTVSWLRALSMWDMLGLALIGTWIALFVEYKALALGKWFYLDTMPMIPILDVGLTPVLQMMILLPLSVWIAGRCMRAIFER